MIIKSYDYRDDEWVYTIINCSHDEMVGEGEEQFFGYDFISLNKNKSLVSRGYVTREQFNQFIIQDNSAKITKKGKTESEYARALLLLK